MLELEIPAAATAARAQLQAAIEARAELVAQAAKAAADEPEALRRCAAAAAALEAAEVDLAVSGDHAALKARDDARRAVEQAEADLLTIQRRRRGFAARLAEAGDQVTAAQAAWRAEIPVLLDRLRELFAIELTEALAPLRQLVRLGFAIDAAFLHDVFGRALTGITIPNPDTRLRRVAVAGVGEMPQPAPALIANGRAWPASRPGAPFDDLRDAGDDPEIAAIVAVLEPFGRTERQAASHLAAVNRERAAAQPAPPPAPATLGPSERDREIARVQSMSDAEYREYRAAEIRAARSYPPPAARTFSQGTNL